ncbi:MAG: ABC transporter ATP-binding protein [Lachnospiraceae bacterium]|jgi:ABC-2 type transport system ATP-binding protein|nr:ABC transporter ATP-binding protein [Lachnospiraceae bacterium]
MIKITNLQKNYKDFSLNVSLEIPAGTVTGLIGKNGAGKSTTIKSILGLIRPDGGSIEVLGKDPKDFTPQDKEKLGVALSDSGFSMMLNITDIIKILKSMYHSFDEKYFREQCKEQGLPFDKTLKDFSTGMKAKLRVLVAISHNAKLLVLDEPTSGLDVLARNEILDILRNYLAQDSERSILISSHISSDLEGLCDDIYMIDKGRILLHEDTDTILGQYGILKISAEEYEKLDKQYLKATKKEYFGYACLTNEKQYYLDNYPNIVVENGNIDDMIMIMLGGK